MKIALLSDIHGNDKALIAVLKEINAAGVKKILFLGDYIGYYYNADIVLDLIHSYDKEMIKGNHELLMKESINDKRKSFENQKAYGSGLEYAKKLLSTEQIKYLINLPEKKELEFDGLKILICHGSPWNNNEYIYPDAPHDKIDRIFQLNYDLVIYGHTHYPALWEKDGKKICNPGSVGQPRDRKPGASWALWDTEINQIILKREYYDTTSLIESCKINDPDNNYLWEVLERT